MKNNPIITNNPINTNEHQWRNQIRWVIGTYWFIGLLVYFLLPSPVFADAPLNEIKGLPGGYQGAPLASAPTTLENIISKTVGFLTVAGGLSFVVYVLLAGLTWITAREESERLSKAKQMLVNALVGLAIVAASWSFTGMMQTIFGFDILAPDQLIRNCLTPGGRC